MSNLPLTRIEETAAEPKAADNNKRPKLASAWGSSSGRIWIKVAVKRRLRIQPM